MVAAVATTDVRNATSNGEALSHMRQNGTLLNFLFLYVLNYCSDDVIQGTLRSVSEPGMRLTYIGNAVLHVLEAFAISLRVRHKTDTTLRASSCNDPFRK